MVLNRYKLGILIQIILIAFVSVLFALTLDKEFVKATRIGLVILWIALILYLYHYVNRIHRDLYRFLQAFRNQDISINFKIGGGRHYFKRIYELFNEISLNFRLVRIEKEQESRFLDLVLKQSASGIIAIGKDGCIKLANKKAHDIAGAEKLTVIGDLTQNLPEFAAVLESKNGGHDHDIKTVRDGKILHLSVRSSKIIIDEEEIHIINIQDITREMDRTEIEAWQKLMRVLNHEITNSISPIHMLSASLKDMYYKDDVLITPVGIDEEFIDSQVLGIRTIVKRSKGLSEFLETYRSLSVSDTPEFKKCSIDNMFKEASSLLAEEISGSGIILSFDVKPGDLEIMADEKMIVQVLINLVMNAVYALEGNENKEIRLFASGTVGRVFIEVRDNGKGITEEVIDNIFTPFFTTRKGGSGIGLSFTRQVMLMHNGQVCVESVPGAYTKFTLTF